MYDQSAFSETLLELALWGKYSGECLPHAWPQPALRRGRWIVTCAWRRYLACFRRVLSQRNRSRRDVEFVDPRVVDINFRPWGNELRHESPRHRGRVDAPLWGAFIYHYVNVPQKWRAFWRDFGLQAARRRAAPTCAEVRAHVLGPCRLSAPPGPACQYTAGLVTGGGC